MVNLSKDIKIEETGRFIRISYIDEKAEQPHEIFLTEKEAKGVEGFLKNYDYTNIRRVIKLSKN